ncbi:OsmC family protein [Chryseobacterium sp. MFBS3-17]|uniref:OsmC family protein n=1 Tax=Chryseobacterium sp. MFBS3-17 TaxID=2886689 RepID=UPI001D0DCFDD|nr:OsmC family protein [Chryseobacterium sp. MFBS3-17]MCC2589544.1 OsmC family protein [Chryseobacterium sp. MFBS3-17]
MKITLERINNEYLFECRNDAGNTVLLDNTSEAGARGVSPMENLLMSVVACSGIDVVSILKKQRQEVTGFRAETEGERTAVDEAKPFSKITVRFFLEGPVDPEKARKAAALSFEKYCSVSKSLNPEMELLYEVFVNEKPARD